MAAKEEDEALERLAGLWARERRTSAERFAESRRAKSLDARVAEGMALARVEVDELEAVAGGRTRLWLSPPRGVDLDEVRMRSGDPVRLWWTSPDEPDAVRAVVSRSDGKRLSIVVEGDAPDRVFDGGFQVDVESPETTFERGAKAIARFREAKGGTPTADLRALLFGDAKPRRNDRPAVSLVDSGLTERQLEAVRLAMGTKDVALVHGPPGTGKTRTLVEIVRQAVARGERVLVAAPSNAAVDHLGERLVAAGVKVVRLGHPARVSPGMEAHTLDGMLETSEASKLSRRYGDEAAVLRKRWRTGAQRGRLDRDARRQDFAEARRLERDARKVLAIEEERILARCPVVLATVGNAEARAIDELVFDRVVVDEATQGVDPLVLLALARGKVVVLAGDPEQLPPTVIDPEAARAGLAETAFERLRARHGEVITAMLVVQHRMHEAIMAYPSASMYGGALVAAEEARRRGLDAAMGVRDDPSREGPFVFLDTAGKGWDEERAEGDSSTRNPGQAERVAVETRRLLERGLAPAEVAVITPYEAEARLLRSMLHEERKRGLEIGTVDGFQGREKEAIVVDLVRSNAGGDIGFVGDVRRMNVAITRARRFLLVVGDAGTLAGHPYHAGLVDHASATGAYKSAWDDDGDLPLGPPLVGGERRG